MITAERMHEMVLFAQALVKLRDAAQAGTDVTLTASEADAVIAMVQVLRQGPA